MCRFVFFSIVFLGVLVFKSHYICANVISFTFSKFPGRLLIAGYRGRTAVARSEMDCIRSLCAGRLTNCVMSFHDLDGYCIQAPVNVQLVAWDPDKFTKINNDPNWATYITKISPPAIDRPTLLYLLDSVNKGSNLGAKSTQLDLVETGLSMWNGVGPRSSDSHLKYLVSNKDNRAQIPYKMTNGSYHINFSGQYTISAWVKTDISIRKWMPIIEGQPHDTVPDFWFYRSTNHDQLFSSRTYPEFQMFTTINGKGKQYWRHISVVYRGFKDWQFYLNGSNFGQVSFYGDTTSLRFPNTLHLGSNLEDLQFFGSMACVSIHEKAQSQAEVMVLMKSCP